MSKLTQHEKWKHGDFALTSGDGVRFLVPTYQLQAASPVFRDMLDSCSGERGIEFEEKAVTIEAFLNIIDSATLKHYNEVNCAEIVALTQFLRKFDCKAAIGTLQLFIYTNRSLDEVMARFLAAAYLDLPEACAHIIEQSPEAFEWLYSDPGEIPLDWSVYEVLPRQYAWALMAARAHIKDRYRIPYGQPPSVTGPLVGPKARFLYYLRRTIPPEDPRAVEDVDENV